MKKSKRFIFFRIEFLALFLFIFLCSFSSVPSYSELSQTERDGGSAAFDTDQEFKFFPSSQRDPRKSKRSLSGKLEEESPDYRRPASGFLKENELLVKFLPGVSRVTQEGVLGYYGMTVAESFRYTGIQVIKLPPGMNVGKAMGVLMNEPSVVYAEPNFIYTTCDIPNDPRFDDLWGLHNTGQTGGTADADIDAPEAWDIHTGGDVVVGVIDTGVDYTHVDLADNMWINQAEAAGSPGVDDD
ncbi:MAG: hypothetical protein KAT69_10560, partial [Candidatus Aminicenantes bacterium]|nr:hypothetical protein [Candidatus Aminicenantes bacterium]